MTSLLHHLLLLLVVVVCKFLLAIDVLSRAVAAHTVPRLRLLLIVSGALLRQALLLAREVYLGATVVHIIVLLHEHCRGGVTLSRSWLLIVFAR